MNVSHLPHAVKQERAHDLAMSALLGEGLYNFGELVYFLIMKLMHPVLDSLTDSPYAWLRTLLFKYNSGDLQGFELIVKTPDFNAQVRFLYFKREPYAFREQLS